VESTSHSEPASHAESAVTVRCWGVRGSIPSPGESTLRYGGNTSCVEVSSGEDRVILDAGTGIRLLGRRLIEEGRAQRAHVVLSHFHWDHIQGLPFFRLLFEPDTSLVVSGPRQGDAGVAGLLAGQMDPNYFPVPLYSLAAATDFEDLADGRLSEGSIGISAMRVRHPSITMGIRLQVAGHTICYLPDNELEGPTHGLDESGWRKHLVEFVRDADLLLHDAMYTDREYEHCRGWGHSTFRQALNLAGEAGCRRLLFFHHDPDRSDDELDRIVDQFRNEGSRRGLGVEVDAAAEGRECPFTEKT
jgi:phosphoribosyl 1,2-cyclic phosphodiesterase